MPDWYKLLRLLFDPNREAGQTATRLACSVLQDDFRRTELHLAHFAVMLGGHLGHDDGVNHVHDAVARFDVGFDDLRIVW